MSAFFSALNPPAPTPAINMTLCTAYCRSERTLSFFMGRQPVMSSGPPRCRGFTITLRHTAFGRTPLNEWSAWRRDLYLTTHNTHRRQTSVPRGGGAIGTHHTSKPIALYEDSCYTKICYDKVSLSYRSTLLILTTLCAVCWKFCDANFSEIKRLR